MIDACIDPGSAFALCVIAFAAGSTVMVAFVLALGLLGDFDYLAGLQIPREVIIPRP
jgi:hypothetical protein